MRIIFMGTPEFAVPSLRACFEVGEVVAVVTQPDKPKGRGQERAPPPVKVMAQQRGVPVLQPEKIRGTGFAEALRPFSADVGVVAAYGKILPRDVLEVPRHGCVNVHASLLPRWRGAAPIQWAIAAGDATTGVCLMRMEEGLDTGPILSCAEVSIGPDDTSETLHDRLSALGADLLRSELPRYLAGQLVPMPQPSEGVTHAPMIKKEDGRLDFGRSAADLERRVRAFTPWPGAYVYVRDDDRPSLLKIHRARATPRSLDAAPGTVLSVSAEGIEIACAEGALRLLEVQPEGRRRMTAAEFLAGRRIGPGTAPFGGP
jgi:methionyl-tRNA formyltransferase